MEKSFKRFLSSVLAVVMVLASMTIGMTTGVGAATGDFTLSAGAFYNSTTTGKVDPDTNPVESAGLYKAEVTTGSKSFTPGSIGTFATSKKKTLVNNTSFDYEMLSGGTRTITVTPENSGTATVYVYHDGTKNLKINGVTATPQAAAYTVTGYDVSCEAGSSFTVDFTTNIVFVGITFTAGEVITYNWTLDTSDLTIVDGSKLSFGSDTTTAVKNTLSYSGDDYALNSEFATITDSTAGVTVDGTNITVKPADDWFTKVVAEQVITDRATLTATSKMETLTKSTTSDDGYFVLLEGLSAAEQSATVDGLGTYGFVFKSNGKTTLSNNIPTNRGIKFTTAGAGTVQVISKSGTSSEDRDFCVYASDGTVVDTKTALGAEVTLTMTTLPKADTYYIACPSKACNFYSFNVVVGNGLSTATGGQVYADTADSYAIVGISAADVASSSVDVNIGDQKVNTDTVYTQAVIDGNLIKASDIGSDYLFAVKVEGAAGNTFDFTKTLNQ